MHSITQGIPGVSRMGALKYISSRDRMRSVTEELMTWNKDKEQIQAKYEQLSEIKTVPHCSICKHNGSKKEHNSGGCSQCPNNCIPHNDYNATQCQCIKHIATRLLSSAHMQCCVKFTGVPITIPTKEIVSEFYNTPTPVLDSTWSVPHGYDFVNLMHQKLEWRRCNAALKFSHIAAIQLISQNIEYSAPLALDVNNVVKFNHILKTRVKDGVDMLELEFQIIDKSLAGCAEFDILYLILERGFVQQVLPKAVAEFEALALKHKRKKKETTTIIERHSPKAPTPVLIEEKPKPKKRAPKKKKEVTPVPSPPPLDDITDGIESVDLNNSSDEEILPLTERLARRKHSNFSLQSSATSLTSESEKSVAKWLSSESLSSEADDKENTAPPTPRSREDSNQTDAEKNLHLTTEPLDREDSNVQIIPDEFMAEYLDLSRNEILEISQNHGSESPTFSREPTFEVSESVTSDDYRLRLSEVDYNQLAFVTPLKPAGGLDEEVEGGLSPGDKCYSGLNEGRGDAFGDGLGVSSAGVQHDGYLVEGDVLDNDGAGYVGVADGSFTDVTDLTYGMNDSQALNGNSYLDGMDDSFGLRVNDNGSVIIGGMGDTAGIVANEKMEDSFVVQEEFNDESLIELTKQMNLSATEIPSDLMLHQDEAQETVIQVENTSQNVAAEVNDTRLDSFIDHVLADTSQFRQITAEAMDLSQNVEAAVYGIDDVSQSADFLVQNESYFNDTMEAQLLQAAAENDISYRTNVTFNDTMDPALEAELVQAAEQLLLNVESPSATSELPQRDVIFIDAGPELVQHGIDPEASFDDSIIEISKPHPAIILSDTPNLTLDSCAFSPASPASRVTSANTTFAKDIEPVRQDLAASFDNNLSSFSPASRLTSTDTTFATPSKLPDISSFSPTAPLSPIPHIGECDLSLDLSTEQSELQSHAESLKAATHPLDFSLGTEKRAIDLSLMSAERPLPLDLSLDKTDSLSLDTTGHLSLNGKVEDLSFTHIPLQEELSLNRHSPLPDLSVPALPDIEKHLEEAPEQENFQSAIMLAEDMFEHTLPLEEPFKPQDMVPASLITNPNLPTAPRPLPRTFSFSNPNQPTASLLTTSISNPNLLTNPRSVPPPFIDPILEVTTPVAVWKKRPLSDITNTSTPNSSQRNSDHVPAFDIEPLPDIGSNIDLDKRFDIDISNLLNST